MGIIKDCPRSSMEKCTDKYGCVGACKAVEQFEKEWREEQEPVAWIHNFIDGGFTKSRPNDLDRYPDRWTALYKDPTPCQTCEALARTVMMDQTSHDTKREWIKLTKEEMDYIEGMTLDRSDAIRMAAVALQEKNGG